MNWEVLRHFIVAQQVIRMGRNNTANSAGRIRDVALETRNYMDMQVEDCLTR